MADEQDGEESEPLDANLYFQEVSGKHQVIRIRACCAEPELGIGYIAAGDDGHLEATVACENCDEHWLFFEIESQELFKQRMELHDAN